MNVLFFGAGPLGTVYAHLLHESGADVSVLARGERFTWLRENGLVVHNEMTGERATSQVEVVDELAPDDPYDLVIVLVRKNRLGPILAQLARCDGVKNVLFMGNNATGFDDYLEHLTAEKVLFGFPGAGGGMRDQVVHFADREKPGGKRRPVTIGEIDGVTRDRTKAVQQLFENAGVPVDLERGIDGWLKYHVALVSPFVGALYKHDCDNYAAAKDSETIRSLVLAAREGAAVLKALGYRQLPVEFKLISWLPLFMNTLALKGMMGSRFAEIAFAIHARAALDEMLELAQDFKALVDQSGLETPNIDVLRSYAIEAGGK